jgi:hypothetical protein
VQERFSREFRRVHKFASSLEINEKKIRKERKKKEERRAFQQHLSSKRLRARNE